MAAVRAALSFPHGTECGENLLHVGEVDFENLVIGQVGVKVLEDKAVRRPVLRGQSRASKGKSSTGLSARGLCITDTDQKYSCMHM